MKLLDFFKKKDNKDKGTDTVAFTTKNVMLENRLITRVYHNSDNFFEFFDDYSTNSNENIMIVGLQEIIKKDPSVDITLNIPQGYCAIRKTKQDKWIIEIFKEEEDDDE